MKKLLLSLTLISLFHFANGQVSIDSATRVYDYFSSFIPTPGVIPTGVDMDTVPVMDNNSWFYIAACDSGNLSFDFNYIVNCPGGIGYNCQNSAGYLVYGPFSDTTNIQTNILTVSPLKFLYHNLLSGSPITSYLNFNYTPGIYYILVTTTDSIEVVLGSGGMINAHTDKTCSVCNGVNNLNETKICLITLDSATNRNEIIIEKGQTDNIEGYHILRENSISNQFDSLTFIHVDSLGVFLDNSANPSSRTWRYKTYSEDVCGNSRVSVGVGPAGLYNTIHLQQGVSTMNTIDLTWNSANPGYDFIQSWYIYRGNSTSTMILIDSIPYSITMYTDVNPQPGTNIYQVALRKNNPCIISRDSGEARSNFISSTFTSLPENNSSLNFNLFPNPVHDILNIQLPGSVKKSGFEISDVKGRIVLNGSFNSDCQVNTGSLSPGFYTLKINSDGKTGYRKFIVQ